MNREKAKTFSPFLITLIGAVLLLVMLVLPYASAADEHKEFLTDHADSFYVEEIGMTNAEAVNISLVEYIRIYAEAVNQGLQKEASIACIVIISIFIGLSGITLLLALCRKPIGMIVSDLLALAAFGIIHFDFKDRGILPSHSYDWGIANYLTYVIGIVIAAGAVWLLIEKRSIKKSAQAEGA